MHTEQNFSQKTKRFFEPFRSNKLITLYFIAYFLLQLSFGVILVFLVRDATDALISGNSDIFYSTLGYYAILLVALLIVMMYTHTSWTYSYNRYRSFIESKYLPKYIRFDTNFQESVGTGKSIAIITKGVKTWGMLLDNVMVHALRFLTGVGLTLYLLANISYLLTFVLIILLVFANICGLWLNTRVLKYRRQRIELDNIWSKNIVKIIMAKMEILQSQKIKREVGILHDLHEGQIFFNKKMSLYLVPFFALGILVSGILLLVIFLYFGDLYFSQEISIGTIAALTGAVLMMQTSFTGMLDFLKNFTKDFAEVKVMWDFFDQAPEIIGYDRGKDFVHSNGKIELKNLSYGYNSDNLVFDNISLSIPGNSVTALVGPSGGGKSTLVKLIAGYIKQDSGNIYVDNQDLENISLKSYYKDVGYLTQEPSVFDGSIRENLMYAVSTRVEEEYIDEIIKLAHCEFIYELPNGLDTEIGERGVKLSGGQKQRLAIAKIFLKNPKIIILDEPTSALDSISEQKITRAMHELFKDRTVLVIAHRLQTVKYANDIIVIEGGVIKERGTHGDLTEKGGFYKQMLDLQSGF